MNDQDQDKFIYGRDEEQYILQSMDAINQAMTPFVISIAKIDFFGTALGRYLAISLFPGGALIFLGLAYSAELHSYWSSLFLELSSGFFFFAAAARVIHLGRKYPWQVPLVGLLVAGPLLCLAYYCRQLFPHLSDPTADFLQSVLIEYSIALLLIVGLEIAMAPWLETLNQKYQGALAELKQLKQEADKPLASAKIN